MCTPRKNKKKIIFRTINYLMVTLCWRWKTPIGVTWPTISSYAFIFNGNMISIVRYEYLSQVQGAVCNGSCFARTYRHKIAHLVAQLNSPFTLV